MQNRKTIAAISAVIAVAAIVGISTTMPQAQASHYGEPTMFVNGINSYSTHSYIYTVNPGTADLDVALQIKDMKEKSNVRLTVMDPAGAVTMCPYTPAGFNLLVAECVISAPMPGIWTLSITSVALGSAPEPVGYSIAADTTW